MKTGKRTEKQTVPLFLFQKAAVFQRDDLPAGVGKQPGVAAGDKYLLALYAVEQIILPGVIQLAEHIVQQQHRRLRGDFSNQLQLGDLGAQHNTAALALAGVGAGIGIIQPKADIVAVNTHRAEACAGIGRAGAAQRLQQRLGLPFLRRAGQVRQLQTFAAIRNTAVLFGRRLRQCGGILSPPCRNGCAVQGKLCIKRLQQLRRGIAKSVFCRFQTGIFLQQRTGIAARFSR